MRIFKMALRSLMRRPMASKRTFCSAKASALSWDPARFNGANIVVKKVDPTFELELDLALEGDHRHHRHHHFQLDT